jgi:hypothetical protein
MNNVHERLPGAFTTPVQLSAASTGQASSQPGMSSMRGFDSIRQSLGPGDLACGNSMCADNGGLVQQLLTIVQQLLSMLGMGGDFTHEPHAPVQRQYEDVQ